MIFYCFIVAGTDVKKTRLGRDPQTSRSNQCNSGEVGLLARKGFDIFKEISIWTFVYTPCQTVGHFSKSRYIVFASI